MENSSDEGQTPAHSKTRNRLFAFNSSNDESTNCNRVRGATSKIRKNSKSPSPETSKKRYCLDNLVEQCQLDHSPSRRRPIDSSPVSPGCSVTISPARSPVPQDIERVQLWVNMFENFPAEERQTGITTLINSLGTFDLHHAKSTLKPLFKRDFIALLPAEMIFTIMVKLNVDDLMNCARVSRTWRNASENSRLWKRICDKMDYLDDFPPSKQFGPLFKRSPLKAKYVRYRQVLYNWRHRRACLDGGQQRMGESLPLLRSTDLKAKVLQTHNDNVITCLQLATEHIVTGSDDNDARVFDADGNLQHVLKGHTGGVWSLQVSEQLRLVVTGSTDRSIRVWNIDTRLCDAWHCMEICLNTQLICISIFRLVSGARDGNIRTWDLNTNQLVRAFSGHSTSVRSIHFDGDLIVSGSYDSTVRVWSFLQQRPLHTMHGHLNRVYTLCVDQERRVIFSGSLDTTIRMWNLDTGENMQMLIGHRSLTSGMVIVNNYLVSCNADSTIRLWNRQDGTHQVTLPGENEEGHMSAVTSLAVVMRNLLVTSSDDGTVKLWDLETKKFLRNLVVLPRFIDGTGSGCIWRLKASNTKLVCAAGDRQETTATQLIIIDFNEDCM